MPLGAYVPVAEPEGAAGEPEWLMGCFQGPRWASMGDCGRFDGGGLVREDCGLAKLC